MRVAASIGVAFAEPGISAGDLLRNADLAMYRAKAGGKDRVEMYVPQMQADAVRRTELQGRLRTASARRGVRPAAPARRRPGHRAGGRVAAQPRWRSAQGILFTPAEFLRVTDDGGERAAELGRWMLDEGRGTGGRAAPRRSPRPLSP